MVNILFLVWSFFFFYVEFVSIDVFLVGDVVKVNICIKDEYDVLFVRWNVGFR